MEQEFAEEFFLNLVKTKKAKEGRRKHIHKTRRERESETEKISSKELRPSIFSRAEEEQEEEQELEEITEEETKTRKPLLSPLPSQVPHVPTPPARLLVGEPQVPHVPKFPGIRRLSEEIDLGKLNPFIDDREVESIQCEGSFIPIKIVRKGELEDTDVSLDDREINGIINEFAEKTDARISSPVFKASFRNLKFSAVVSQYASSKFIITKK